MAYSTMRRAERSVRLQTMARSTSTSPAVTPKADDGRADSAVTIAGACPKSERGATMAALETTTRRAPQERAARAWRCAHGWFRPMLHRRQSRRRVPGGVDCFGNAWGAELRIVCALPAPSAAHEWRRRVKVVIAALLTLALVGQVSQPPRIRTGINVVEVDIVVVDDNGAPVRELRQQDFRVEEDGRPVEIASFTAIDLPMASADTAIPRLDSSGSAAGNNAQPGDGRVVLVILDDYHVSFDAGRMGAARTAVKRMIERMGPSDLAAVMATSGHGASIVSRCRREHLPGGAWRSARARRLSARRHSSDWKARSQAGACVHSRASGLVSRVIRVIRGSWNPRPTS